MAVDKVFYNEGSAAKLGWNPSWFGADDFDDDLVFLNQIIGKKIKIHKTGYCCLSCYENLQIFANGFCKF